MSEKPIIFSTEMVRAILNGSKTQTRRVVKPQPDHRHRKIEFEIDTLKEYSRISGCWNVIRETKCPYGKPGTVLWVRERIDNRPKHGNFYYHADNQGVGEAVFDTLINKGWVDKKSIPSIHMPRKAARLFLRVKNVRVERLQDITEADAIAEGICQVDSRKWESSFRLGWFDSPILAFKQLWDSINAKQGFGWDINPWVWVIEFEVVRR